MPTWAKVLLIVVAVFFLGVVAVVFIGYRWMKTNAPHLQEDVQKMQAEGGEFGRGKEANACIAEAFARVDRCDGIFCEVKTKMFLQSCLAASTVPENFCAGVPKRGEIMATAQWTLSECARRGRPNDQRCSRLIGSLQDYCSTRR